MNKPGTLALIAPFTGVLGLLLMFTTAAAATPPPPAPGALNPAKVPAAYVQWVQAAGTECAQASAPLIAAQIQQESGWNPNAVSPAGAEGIAQFMPGTWPSWGRDDDHTGNISPFNPADAIMAMGRYDCALAAQVAAVPGDTTSNMLAAYNAGPGAVIAAGGVPAIPETQQYVADILALIPTYELAAPTGSAPPGSFAAREIAAASRYLGIPYVWGGGGDQGPTTGAGGTLVGFDCSGLVKYAVYQASGGAIDLPRTSEQQATTGQEIPRAGLQPGDVIAFQVVPRDYSHIAIYIGGGQIIEAPHTGAFVEISSLSFYDGVAQSIRRFG